mgnify:CR=1 FL=1
MRWKIADGWLKLRILYWHLCHAIEAWRAETRFDERICCGGRDCGCYGASWRQFWESELRRRKGA